MKLESIWNLWSVPGEGRDTISGRHQWLRLRTVELTRNAELPSVGQRSHVVIGVERQKGMERHHYPPPGWQPREQSHPGRTMQMNLSSCPTTSKKASQAARKAAAATMGFPTPVLSKVQALELLKGDLDGELYLELQSQLAKPKVVPPKKKEDALLRKRIEKDKSPGSSGWA